MRYREYHKSPFTLIELLIVIAIVTLLVAILLPSLSRARAVGKKLACMSNTRQLISALTMYAADNAGWLGYSEYHGQGFYSVTELGILYLYISALDPAKKHTTSATSARYLTVGVCPSVLKVAPSGFERWGLGANRYVMSDNWYTAYNKMARCRKPSITAVFGDSTTDLQTFKGISCAWMDYPSIYACKSANFDRHLKKGNFSFLDGHAESLTLQDSLNKGMSSTSYRCWGATWSFLPSAGF